VIAEIDESLTLDPKDAEAKITPRTKAIMPVHMCGLPADLNAIMRVARRHKVKLVEDACQADGGSYKGKRLGSVGDVGAFSFNFYKNITSGEGGAIVTDDNVAFERALIHHDGGALFRPHAKDIGVPFFAGWNFRLNEILGAVLRVQLKRIDGLLKRTRAAKHRIVEGLSGYPGITFITHNDLDGDCGTTVGFLFDSEKRMRGFIEAFSSHGIESWSPIDSGRHVYTNWEPVMEKRGSYHPAIDAYRRVENRGASDNYTADMCPRTLDILSRTAFINTSPQQKAADIRRVIAACKKAADAVR
jgi:dTDP-4-amino-4,6-dideoxygalactose transaminase